MKNKNNRNAYFCENKKNKLYGLEWTWCWTCWNHHKTNGTFSFFFKFVCKKWKEAFRLFILVPSSLNQMDKIPGIDKMEPLPLEFIQWTCHVKQMKPLWDIHQKTTSIWFVFTWKSCSFSSPLWNFIIFVLTVFSFLYSTMFVLFYLHYDKWYLHL